MWHRAKFIFSGCLLIWFGWSLAETKDIFYGGARFPLPEWVGWANAALGFVCLLYGIFFQKKIIKHIASYYVICTQCKNSFYGHEVKNNRCLDCGGLTVDMKGYQETFARMGIEEEPAQETLTDELTPNNQDNPDKPEEQYLPETEQKK